MPAPLAAPRPPEHLETVIGQKWIGWVAVVLIFCAVAFFLKYAFENRWIGELGRVTLGVVVGLVFAWGGLERHRKGWRYLSQVLTGGGITILYLSVYGAFGYYHLVDQRAAFVFLAILVAEAQLLALAYDARPIAVMALAGGFLAPVLLSTGRDQYAVLFTYIAVLDLGMLLAVMARRWRWIGSLAYAATQLLFWAWYGEHYHPDKRAAVLLFQAAIFALFMLADLAPRLRRKATGWEEWIRLAVNPFVFYATCYYFLNPDHHDWMAPLALGLAIVYAALARAELGLRPSDRSMLLVTVGTALTFVTLAIPVQLESNWITIAWAVEAAVLLWASFEAAAPPLRVLSAIVYSLALIRFVFQDTPWESRATFTPVLNRYFLGTLALTACLGAATYLYRRLVSRDGAALRWGLVWGLLGAGVLWLGSSVEAYTYFSTPGGCIVAQPGTGRRRGSEQPALERAARAIDSVVGFCGVAHGGGLPIPTAGLACGGSGAFRNHPGQSGFPGHLGARTVLSHPRAAGSGAGADGGGVGVPARGAKGAGKMRRIPVAIGAGALCAALWAQAPRSPERLSAWQYFREVQVPHVHVSDRLAGFCARWRDAGSNRAPTARISACMTARGRFRTSCACGARSTPAGLSPPANSIAAPKAASPQVSYDLGEQPQQHNEVEIETAGDNFRRLVDVQGSSDGVQWSTLVSGAIAFRFTARGRTVEQKSVDYPVSRYRYLRIRVERDAQVDRSAPELKAVEIFRSVKVKGEMVSFRGGLEQRDSDRLYGQARVHLARGLRRTHPSRARSAHHGQWSFFAPLSIGRD